MAIYRTRAHYDIDALKYEHEYIINHYSDWFRNLQIETPEYSIHKEDCKYKFTIMPHGRTIVIQIETTFGDTCTDRTCLRFVAECFDDSRTSNSHNRRSNSIHHRRHSSKRSYRISSSSQNSRPLAEDETSISHERRTISTDLYDSDEGSTIHDSGSKTNRMILFIADKETFKKIRVKILCSFYRLVLNDGFERICSTSMENSSIETNKNDVSSYEAFRDKVPYDFHIDIGSHRYATHRNILILRSDYFKTLFESQFNDCSKNQLKLNDDINHSVFSILLTYLYTDRLEENEINESNLLELFKLSDRFLINSLRQKSLIELLRNYVNKETVFSYLALLDTYDNCDELRDKCFDIFHKNPSLLKTSEFGQLEKSNAKLAFQIYRSFF